MLVAVAGFALAVAAALVVGLVASVVLYSFVSGGGELALLVSSWVWCKWARRADERGDPVNRRDCDGCLCVRVDQLRQRELTSIQEDFLRTAQDRVALVQSEANIYLFGKVSGGRAADDCPAYHVFAGCRWGRFHSRDFAVLQGTGSSPSR